MFHFRVLTVLGLIFLRYTLIRSSTEPDQVAAKLEVIEDVERFRSSRPHISLAALLKTEDRERGVIRYKVGNRVSGDELVGLSSDSYEFGSLQDVELVIRYPASGYGAVVTHVVIQVRQSSNQGRAFVRSGGIGQNFIEIVIQAHRTSYLSYNAQFFGYY